MKSMVVVSRRWMWVESMGVIVRRYIYIYIYIYYIYRQGLMSSPKGCKERPTTCNCI